MFEGFKFLHLWGYRVDPGHGGRCKRHTHTESRGGEGPSWWEGQERDWEDPETKQRSPDRSFRGQEVLKRGCAPDDST